MLSRYAHSTKRRSRNSSRSRSKNVYLIYCITVLTIGAFFTSPSLRPSPSNSSPSSLLAMASSASSSYRLSTSTLHSAPLLKQRSVSNAKVNSSSRIRRSLFSSAESAFISNTNDSSMGMGMGIDKRLFRPKFLQLGSNASNSRGMKDPKKSTIAPISWPSLSLFYRHKTYYSTTLSSLSSSNNDNNIGSSNRDNNSVFHQGDKVQLNHEGINYEGIICERKGGWYTVQIIKKDEDGYGSTNDQIVKKRASQMKISQTLVAELDLYSSSSSDNSSTNKDVISAPQTPPTSLQETDNVRNRITIPYSDDKFDVEQIQKVPDVLTIIDLDAAMLNQRLQKDEIKNLRDLQYIEQCFEFEKYNEWVVFTDLHCSPLSLTTCLNVLEEVHRTAKERGAGVLFLGDFWHHRGTVRVDCLNAVLNTLSEWEVPMIMIPGNHDQVTLSGLEHALTPLQNAYRIITDEGRNLPGILIFSHPTKIKNALFVPHIRDVASMQSVLHSKVASSSEAVFVHADVTGAYMNDLIVSTHGVSPSYFPPNTPIYSGHFHKPHFVRKATEAPGVNIRYVGSPYETTLAEAGQEKSLLILDSSLGWKCIDEIPLRIGRKHWRIANMDDLLDLDIMDEMSFNDSITGPMPIVLPGDRVVVSVSQEELEIQRQKSKETEGESHILAFDAKVKALRSMGASVEMRETKVAPDALMGSNQHMKTDALNEIDLNWLLVEDMSPQTTWSNFLQNEVKRDAIQNSTATKLLEVGNSILADLDCCHSEEKESHEMNSGQNPAMLMFEEIVIQGFGPFKESITYPLNERGLVLVKGSNQDGGSDSNGTGKSSLAMSTLWALTGTIDARPTQDARVTDIMNDLSKSTRVSLRGKIDDESFVIVRTKTASKGSLTFFLDDVDLTRQSMKETQLIIDEKLGLGTQVLSRIIFHGQHQMNGLLEATDAKLKEELSLIVPLKTWQDAATQSRKKGRALSKRVSELDGMIDIREKDVQLMKRKYEATEEAVTSKEEDMVRQTQKMAQLAKAETEDSSSVDLENKRYLLDETLHEVQSLERKLQSLLASHEEETKPIRVNLTKVESQLTELRRDLLKKQSQSDRNAAALDSAQEMLDKLKDTWGMTDSDNVDDFILPSICPTCKQPASDEISHGHLKSELKAELNTSQKKIEMISSVLHSNNQEINSIEAKLDSAEVEKNYLEMIFKQKEADWEARLELSRNDIQLARSRYTKLSSSFAGDLKKMEYLNNLKQLEATATGELQVCRNNLEMAKESRIRAKQELDNMIQNIKGLDLDRELARSQSATMSNISDYFGARGIQTYVLQNTILALQLVTQSYLDELSDGSLRLQLRLDEGDRISRRASVLNPDGSWVERPLSSLSGGQWRRCSLSLSLGFSDLVARRGRLCSSLLVLDEPLTHLDSKGRDNVGKLLRKVIRNQSLNDNIGIGGLSVTTIIIILQDLVAEELSESFDRIDEVIKHQGHSTVVVDK